MLEEFLLFLSVIVSVTVIIVNVSKMSRALMFSQGLKFTNHRNVLGLLKLVECHTHWSQLVAWMESLKK